MGVKQDTDNIYYWTLNGEWLLDNNGQKVRAQGLDGQNGTDGQPGAPGTDGQNGRDGVTPQLKIENGYWYVSTDNGQNWTQLGRATGENGQDGQNGADGQDGADGESLFSNVDVSNNEFVKFVLTDGTEIKLPTYAAFVALKEQVDQLNQQISSLQTLVEAVQQGDYITSVDRVYEGGIEIGYKISFANRAAIVVRHGEKGEQGVQGEQGIQGPQGEPGQNGSTPIVGVKQDTDNIYYWTLNGEWLLDNNGQKVRAQGLDGQNGTDGQPGASGSDGQNGRDGVTPQLRIQDGYWEVSTDNGQTWTRLGKATGENGQDGQDGQDGADGVSLFSDITVTEDYVTLILRGSGETIELPTKHVFEQLQQQVNTLNTNISALQIIVNALEAKTFITNVVEVSDASNQTIGYKVVLSDNTTFTIYHGRDGTDGDTPHIGVTEIAGVYYWTVDGFLLQDSHGNSIKVTGEDGEDGITPKLKIEDGRWYISYDYGASWRDIGQATGEQGPAGPSGSGNCLFKEVEIDQPTGTFIVTLFDDSRFGLPMYTYFKLVFDISEHAPAVYRKAPGKSFDVMFRFEPFSSNGTSTSADVQISVIGGSKNTVNYDSRGFGTIHLTASYEEKEEQIMVFVKTKAYTTWETFTVITDYDYAEIGDIYYSNHKPEGIVWKKKEGSQKGCMLSCLQYEYGWTGSPATCTWITDTYGYNSGWAYPTIDQLESCIQSITTAGWSDVNEKLVSLGYEEIPHILLSSTYDEVNNRLNLITYDPPTQAVVLRINLEAAGGVYPIRAIKEF